MLSTTKRLALVGLLVLLGRASAWAQQPVAVSSGTAGAIAGTAADAESNTEPFLGRIGMRGYFFNGTTWDRMRGDTTSGLWVNVKNATLAVTQSGAWSLSANQSVNVAQVNGVTPLMGNGVTGTGSPRVTIASDNTAFTVNAAQSGTWTNTVTQATGTNLHMVCDSGCSSSTAPADEAAFTAGTTPQSPVGGFFQTTATNNALTTGQMGAFQLTAQRALFTNLRNASGTEMGTSANPLQVTLANTGANSNKLLVTPDSVALPANQSVNVSQINGVTPLMGAGNTGTGSPRVTVATDQAAIATWGLGATGAAVPSGGQYTAGNAITALPSAATAGNLTGASYDKFGRQVVITGTIRDLRACQTTTISASTSETTIITAAGANVFADPYLFVISNTSASTNTRIDFRDATAGTILFSLYSIGGVGPTGFSLPQSIPQTTANNNWTAQAATSTTDLRVYACYEKNR